MKKTLLVPFFYLISSCCMAQDIKIDSIIPTEKGLKVTYTENGKTKTEIAKEVPDSVAQKDLDEMMKHFGGKPWKKDDTIFNIHHQPIEVRMGFDLFGANKQKFEYDKDHRLVKITGYFKKQIKPFDNEVAIRIFTYDKKGNLIEIRNIGEDGKLISSQFEDSSVIKNVYNNENQLIEEWFLNEKEQLRSEFAILKWQYDKEGKRSKLGWYNVKGEKEPKR